MAPVVSVVIPTRNRHSLVIRSVQSALSQTFKDIEVIVVIDGPDEASRIELSQIDDPRLRVIELLNNLGGGGARNAGVTEAKGQWIAFLDDDDEWLSKKLELQFKMANHSHYDFPIVASRLIARTPKRDFIWPRRLPKPVEPISEYLLVRHSLFRGEGHISTSVIFTKKELLQKEPFQHDLQKFQDFEWLIRVNNLANVGIEFVPEPLAIWYTEEKRATISNTNNWQYSLDVIQKNRHLVTPKAYAAFIVSEVVPPASRAGEWKSFLPLLRETVQLGKPRLIDLLLYLGMWLIPQETRRWLRDFIARKRKIPN